MQHTTTDASSSPAPSADPLLASSDGPAGNAERHALKRTYLTLLPHTQLVELCLAFEAYSPLHVKDSLWPTNLAAAVDELQSVPPPPPSSQDTRKDITSGPAAANAPSTSLSSLPDAIVQPSPTGASGTDTAIDPNLASDNSNGHTTTTGDESSRPQQLRTSNDLSQPIPQPEPSASSSKPSATELPQGSYHHAPYGYPHTQSIPAYPHTPYYPPLNYPHNFPPQPPAGYPHGAFSPSHPPFPPPGPLAHHPHPTGVPSTEHSGMPSDDLPSYEDMLVEALTDMNNSDGSAPKSLFTWMASRYPLHTNFRPSASQALQKAFKRGRLEKGSNGKYRLNASWDGGSTSRRTTRRPQSFAQMVLPSSHGPPTTSPFTHAPLSQPARGTPALGAPTPAPTSIQEKNLPYPHYTYPYPAGAGYLRYGSSAPTPVSKDISAEQQSATAVTDEAALAERNAGDEEVGEGSDAWEAAQAILKAINFGSLLQGAAAKPAAPQTSPAANSVQAEQVSNRVTASASATAGTGQSLSERDRASLQAQLALLAAQLAEIAEDTLASDLNVTDQDAHAEECDDGTVVEDDDMEAVDVSAQEREMD